MKKYPTLQSKVNSRGKMRSPFGVVRKYTIVGEVRRTQSRRPDKKICLQKILHDDGRTELRLAYYIIGKKRSVKGKWVFGQYATFLPINDFKSIIRKAKAKGWI